MQSGKNSHIYTWGTIVLLFALTVGVLFYSGLTGPTQQQTINISSEESAVPLSNDLSVYSLPCKYISATYRELEFQAKSEEIIALYSTQYDLSAYGAEAAADADAPLMMTASIARGMVEESRSEGKAAASMEQVSAYMYVNANQLNVRSGVGTDYDKLTTLKRGDKVGLFRIEGDWAKVKTESGIIGYTVARYLVDSEDKVEPERPIAYWYINANTLNVRSGPGTDYEKIETLKRGDKVGYFDEQGEWARVQTPSGKKGYMLMKYLVDSESEVDRSSSLPVASSSTVTSLAQQIVEYSKTLQGVRYKYGGYSTSGMDCSGFVKYVYAHFGIDVPRSSASYANFGQRVSRENLRPSDILLFDTDGGNWDVSHVGIYIGNNMFIHASTTKGKVVITSLSEYPAPYYGARRVID
ncbi:MAG TPA: SH3 domain-containing protein [Thermoclostridium sp.]|nr:SH3 domain-containing protein [Thermoclostridium sp.]